MQRLVEQPSDEGEMFEGNAALGRVHYHLSVYQHFSEVEGEPVAASFDVEGRVVALDAIDLPVLHSKGSEYTLRLSDGRSLDCSLVDADGLLRSTGRGLYKA